MSKKRKKNNIPMVKKVVESPLMEEIENIKNKIIKEDNEIYNLQDEKRKLTEELVDKILLNSDLQKLIVEYSSIDKKIESRLKAQENRKKDLEFKQKKMEETETIIETPLYKQIGDENYRVGLYNTECKHPVAICCQKMVYLSYNDIRNKHCLKHRNHKPCKHLQWLNSDGLF